MSGPRDKYDSTAYRVDETDDLSRPGPMGERWRLRIQDEMAAAQLYDASLRYNGGRPTPLDLMLFDELWRAHGLGTLDGERLRVDREHWSCISGALRRFITAELRARQQRKRELDAIARKTATRRIVRTPAPIAPKPGALVKRGALYAG